MFSLEIMDIYILLEEMDDGYIEAIGAYKKLKDAQEWINIYRAEGRKIEILALPLR